MGATRRTVRSAGEVLITVGVLTFLFCVYQLFYTNIRSNAEMRSEVSQLQHQWDQQLPAGTPIDVPSPIAAVKPYAGTGFAIIHIPRLGSDYAKPVLEGVDLSELDRGLGHYPSSALPGQVGNFAVAGHRKTHGEPFVHLNQLRLGDKVIVETQATWFTYTVTTAPYITDPTDIGVLDAVPHHPNATPTQRLITLTTCNPEWASYQRMIVIGVLTGQQPRSAGPPPDLS